jgi:hypothetical protein
LIVGPPTFPIAKLIMGVLEISQWEIWTPIRIVR